MPVIPILRRLATLREARGWTQFTLAAYSGVSISTIRRYERGDRHGTAEHVQALADALGCSPLDLYGLREAEDEDEAPAKASVA